MMWSECENGMLTSGSLESQHHIAKRPAFVSFCVLRPVGSNMSGLSQGSIEPCADPSIDVASQFNAVDDAPSKHKRKRGDTAKGKDAQVKFGDHTEDQEVLLPLSRLQWDKKREHGQVRVLDEDLVKDKLKELRRNPPGAAKIRIIVWRDALGQYSILSVQHIAEARGQISREYMNAHLEPPKWPVQFLAQVVRTDVSLHIRESIACTSQVYRL